MLKVIWDSNTLVNPRVKCKATKTNIKEIPVTISAFSMGTFVIAIRIVLGVFFILLIAIAAADPKTVATKAEMNAMIKVVVRAFIISSFWKSSRYQWRVNPPHFALDLEALKDNTINMAMGAYRKRRMIMI
jgi:hypothetical protein